MKTIAVIDDNDDNIFLIQALLEDSYNIVKYSSGVEALEDVNASNADLILLDISLPIMDGMEVLTEFKKREKLKDIPVIAVTANAMKGDEKKYLDYGFDAYIAKPITDEKRLIDKIEQLIAIKKR